jgi:hypothetical protein
MIYSALSPCASRVQGNGKAHAKEAVAGKSYRPCTVNDMKKVVCPVVLSATLHYT